MEFNIVENKDQTKQDNIAQFEAKMAENKANQSTKKVVKVKDHINKENLWNRAPKSVRSIMLSFMVMLFSFIIAYNNNPHQSALVIWVEQIKLWETGFVNFDNGIWINISAFVFYLGFLFVGVYWWLNTRGSIKFEKMITKLLWQQELFDLAPAIIKGNVAEQVELAYTKTKPNGKKVKRKKIKAIMLEVERQWRLIIVPYLEAMGINNEKEKV